MTNFYLINISSIFVHIFNSIIMKILASVLLITLMIKTSLPAQEIITAAGDYSTASTSSLQWTIGQLVTGASSNGNIVLINGFQQSILTISKISENDLSNNIRIFPNPTNSYLEVEIDNPDFKTFTIRIYNIMGKLYYEEKILDKKQIIYLSNFCNGTYIIQITNKNILISTHKVIKQ